ncbi:MAG: peroxiredoxin [Clostridia bacterium]|nr:peroxiredoxin [Clostridia bacterium]
MLEVGIKAPEFALPDQNGNIHRLSEYRGQKVILYFYPKDMTGGCTSQACNFRDRYPQFQEKGAVVLGVSKDTVESHKRFEEKHGLPFPLLADTELKVITAYDVLKPGTDGKLTKSLIRSTYLIDENGIIAKAFGSVKPKENADQMLEAL